jgi:hypothetical protein
MTEKLFIKSNEIMCSYSALIHFVAYKTKFMKCDLSEDRIPMEIRFFTPLQTGPGTRKTSSKQGTLSLSPGVKRPDRRLHHPPLSSPEVKERVQLNLYLPSGTLWPVIE